MNLVSRLREMFRPPVIDDPAFGRLTYMHIRRNPSRSYWEGEWLFPPTGTRVCVTLPGGEAGPRPEARTFYLDLVPRFAELVTAARPPLDAVFREWLKRPLSDDLWKDVKLAGFGVEDPSAQPPHLDVSFETIGNEWLGIIVPLVGSVAQQAIVDT